MRFPVPERLRAAARLFRAGAAVLALLAGTAASFASARLPENAVDIIDGASRNRHGDIFAEGIAA